MMFLLFVLTGAANSVFEEKQSCIVLRILAAPVTRVQVLWSKYLFHISLGVIQLIVLFIAGALLLRIDIVSNAWNLLLVMIAASTDVQRVRHFAGGCLQYTRTGPWTLLILAMRSMGGAWFPTSFMPPFLQKSSHASRFFVAK